MNDPAFEELCSKWIDGDISADEAMQLKSFLDEDPERVEKLRLDLRFADLLEQQLCPWRSFNSFVNGLETRTHAEQTGEEFIRELIPRLREVDERRAEAAVVAVDFSQRAASASGSRRNARPWRLGNGWMTSGLAAAAALTAGLFWWVYRPVEPGPVAKITGMEGVVWEKPTGPIEWKVGDDVRPGDGMRLRSGWAQLQLANGNVVTLEGPADLEFLSETEGVLREGTGLAEFRPGNKPFRVGGLGTEITVEPGSAVVRFVEADQNVKRERDSSGEPMLARIESSETPDGRAEDSSRASRGRDEGMPATASDGPSEPETLPHYRLSGEDAPVLLVLEDDDLPQLEPIEVDMVPGANLDVSLASPKEAKNRPSIESASPVRSYLVRMTNSGQTSEDSKDYVNATVRFDSPILGVSATNDPQDVEDELAQFDPKDMDARKKAWKRGLKPAGEFIHIREDGRTLDLRVPKNNPSQVRQFRVFVKGE